MIQLLKLGWRNIFRNKRRTILTAVVIGLGLASLILQSSIFVGMMDNLFKRATSTFLGQAQIHNKEFLENFDIEKVILDEKELIRYLEKDNNVEFSPRIVALSMLSSPRNGIPTTLYGIDILREPKVSKVKKSIIKGEFLKDENSILIGDKLAELLEVDVKDHIVATVSKAETEELSQELFTIGGIFSFRDPQFDKGVCFIVLSKAQKLINLQGKIHEIVLQFRGGSIETPLSLSLQEKVKQMGNEILSWKKLVPSIEAILDLSDFMIFIIIFIVFLLVVFIILNTLFMAIFERFQEFGVLRSVGTTPFQIFSLILIEAGSLTIVSTILGVVIALGVYTILAITGIDYAGIDIGGVTMAEPIYPVFEGTKLILFPLYVFLFTILAALYPAIIAARITPIKAMQKE